jgi:superfamily I DNA and/or RNA helicase
MDYLKEFSEIRFLFGYFCQYWVVFYEWGGREPTFQAVIRSFKTENSIEVIEKLAFEIEKFLVLPLNREEFNSVVVEELGSELIETIDGFDRRQFLEESLNILKEPMEETKKHFVPKFIG